MAGEGPGRRGRLLSDLDPRRGEVGQGRVPGCSARTRTPAVQTPRAPATALVSPTPPHVHQSTGRPLCSRKTRPLGRMIWR